MAGVGSDAREYLKGRSPSDWNLIGSSSTLIVDGPFVDPRRKRFFDLRGSSTGKELWLFGALDAASDLAAQEVLALVRIDTPGDGFEALAAIRGSGSAGSVNAYVVKRSSATQIQLVKWAAGAETVLATATRTISDSRWYWVRLRGGLTTISAKAWALDAIEPSPWDISVVDAALATGSPGLAIDQAAVVRLLYEQFNCATGGATAAAFTHRSLAAALADTAAELNITAEIEQRDRVTDVENSLWASFVEVGTGPEDYPANTTMEAILLPPGEITERLDEDVLFGGFGLTVPSSVSLKNRSSKLSNSPYLIRSKSFSGRRLTLRMGEVGKPHRAFEVVCTAMIAANPAIGDEVRFQLASPSERLDRPALIPRYRGNPVGPSFNGGAAVAAHIDAYDLVNFAVGCAFRVSGSPSAAVDLLVKQLSVTNQNYALRMATDGSVSGSTSVGGVAGLNLLTSPSGLNDGLFHVAVYGHSTTEGRYLLILHVDPLVAETLLQASSDGAPDTQAASVTWGANATTDLLCDHRIYGYISPAQARDEFATWLGEARDSSVAVWPGNEGLGSAVTDYSINANNATLSGTFLWVPTDLGLPEQAGQPRVISDGVLLQAAMRKIDSVNGRYEYADRSVVGFYVVKAQGALLAEPTDYSNQGNGIIQTVALSTKSEPFTIDLLGATGGFGETEDNQNYYIAQLVQRFLLARTDLEATRDLADSEWDAMKLLLPWRSGYTYTNGTNVGAFLREAMGPVGVYLGQDESGRLLPGFLLPTVLPGPYGSNVPCVEFLGHADAGITWEGLDGPGATFTYTTWVKPWGVQVDGYAGRLQGLIDNYIHLAMAFGGNGRLVAQQLSSLAALVSPSQAVDFDGWYLVAVIRDPTNASPTLRQRLLVGKVFGAVTMVANSEIVGSYSPPATQNLRLGNGAVGGSLFSGFWGAMSETTRWNRALTDAELQTIVDAPVVPGSSGLEFHAPLSEGAGHRCKDLVSGTYGTMIGCRWAPAMTIDLYSTVNALLDEQQDGRATWSVPLGYAKVWRPLTESEITGSVTGNARIALKELGRIAPASNSAERADDRNARELPLAWSFLEREFDAKRAATMLRSRLSADRAVARLSSVERALLLRLTDEVLVIGPNGLGNGSSFRAAELSRSFEMSRASGLPGSTFGLSRLGLWGNNPPIALETEAGVAFITEDGKLLVEE